MSKKNEIRDLKPEEIQCRAQIVKEKGFSLLLYKDARCDQEILDETFGMFGWKREHSRDNANCTVSVWDKEKEQWVSKEDTGAESNTEKAKGLASDSFKRACFNWGVGRELYTAPFVWINANNDELYNKNGKWRLKANVEFAVQDIEIENKVIQKLTIVDKNLNVRYQYPRNSSNKPKKNNVSKKTDDDKDWLNEGMDEWRRIEKSVDSGDMKPSEIRDYFKVSKDNMAYFEDIAKKGIPEYLPQ